MQRVLVIDDSSLARATARLACSRLHWECLEAHDGIEGKRMAEELQPDAVIVSLHVPALSGAGLVGAVRAACPGARIIVIGACGDEVPLGTDRMLSRPAAPADLARLLAEGLAVFAGELAA
ncbi:MAG: response regulator [Phycisphaerales bacterium]